MTEWASKRFWKNASAVQVKAGHGVHLDGRPVRTPAKNALVLPTRAMAEAIAAEWAAQDVEVRPLSMPVTRAANAAIDRVQPRKAEVAALIAAYGESDLLCHRADAPQALVERQAAAWDPLLDWAREALGAPLTPVCGVIPHDQPIASLQRLQAEVSRLDAFALTALHDLVGLSGSLVIGLAAMGEAHDLDELWEISRIDETWQAEQWGMDDEAVEVTAGKRRDFLQARRFLELGRAS